MSQRTIILAVFSVQLVASVLIAVGQLLYAGPGLVTWFAVAGAAVNAALMIAYLRGFEVARLLNVLFVTILIGSTVPEPYVSSQQVFLVLIPSALALLLAPASWIIGAMLAVIGILMLRGGLLIAYTNDLRTIGQLVIIIGSMYLARRVAEAARATAERSAAAAEAARATAELRAAALAAQTTELSAQNQRQRQLLDLVATLEVPTVNLADGVLLAPLVGAVDAERASALTTRLLRSVSAQRARMLVLDIAGVQALDPAVARLLLESARAVRLLGCAVTITGIAPELALMLTANGVDLGEIQTARSPQEALAARV